MDVNWQTCKLKPYEFSSHLIHGPKIHLSEDSCQEWQRPGSWGKLEGFLFLIISTRSRNTKRKWPSFKIKTVIDQVQDHSGRGTGSLGTLWCLLVYFCIGLKCKYWRGGVQRYYILHKALQIPLRGRTKPFGNTFIKSKILKIRTSYYKHVGNITILPDMSTFA